MRLKKHEPITAVLASLNWLPVHFRIRYKILLFVCRKVFYFLLFYFEIVVMSLPFRAHHFLIPDFAFGGMVALVCVT